MDEDGLPIVGTGIDFTKVKPLDKKQLLAFINHYVAHTVRFLNKFSGVCEEKMTRIESQIQRLEVTLNILEAKLSSIPGMDEIKVAQTQTSQTQTAQSNASTSAPSTEQAPAPPASGPPPPPPPPGAANSAQEQAPPPPPVVEEQFVKVCQDPRYMRFFKMMNVGVPPPAVKLKMAAEGLNPDYLDTPDAPAPPNNAPAPRKDDSSDDDAEYTDSD